MITEDIDWKRVDGSLKRLSAGSGSSVRRDRDAALSRDDRLRLRELRSLSVELRDRLRRSELELERVREDNRGLRKGMGGAGKLQEASDVFDVVQSQIKKMEQQVRQHAQIIEEKETIILRQRSANAALEDKVEGLQEELDSYRHSLKLAQGSQASDKQISRDSRSAEKEKLGHAQGQITWLTAELQQSRATAAALRQQLREEEKLRRNLAKEVEGLQLDKLSTDKTQRMYQDAKYEADRFRREAAALASVLGKADPTSASRAADPNRRASEDFAAGILSQGRQGKRKSVVNSNARRLHKEWHLCPGGLAYIGDDDEDLNEKIKAIGKMVRTGGGFAGVIEIAEDGVFVKQEDGWVPARTIDVISNFRRSFCPDLEWSLFEMLALVLNKIFKTREAEKMRALQRRHRARVCDLKRTLNQRKSMVVVQQMQKIASLRAQLEEQRSQAKAPRTPKKGLGPAARVTMDKNLQLAQQVDDLGLENLRLRDVIRKAATATQHVSSLHRDGAMSQVYQVQRSMQMARSQLNALLNECGGTMKRTSQHQPNRDITAQILRAHNTLADGVMAVLDACEEDARQYTPPLSK